MTEELIKEARALPEAFRKVQLEESRYLEEDALAELDAVGYSAVVLAQKLADALEKGAQEAKSRGDEREAAGETDELHIERSFTQWRDSEFDRTGALPEGYAMFRAGYLRAVAAISGEHDHIDDGHSYLDCAACAAAGIEVGPGWEDSISFGSQLENGYITLEVRGPEYATHRRVIRRGPWEPVGGESE